MNFESVWSMGIGSVLMCEYRGPAREQGERYPLDLTAIIAGKSDRGKLLQETELLRECARSWIRLPGKLPDEG